MSLKHKQQAFFFVCGSVVGLVLIYVVVTNPGYDHTRTIHGKVLFEHPHDKTNKVACAPSEDSDQPGRMPRLI